MWFKYDYFLLSCTKCTLSVHWCKRFRMLKYFPRYFVILVLVFQLPNICTQGCAFWILMFKVKSMTWVPFFKSVCSKTYIGFCFPPPPNSQLPGIQFPFSSTAPQGGIHFYSYNWRVFLVNFGCFSKLYCCVGRSLFSGLAGICILFWLCFCW